MMIRHIENEMHAEYPPLEFPPTNGEKKGKLPVLGPMILPQPEPPAPPPSTQEESELLDARAFGHRATGKTYRQIARLLNIPSSSAYKRVQREMGRRREEFAEDEADSRELIVALLDGALEGIATQAYNGDQKAFHLLLQYANTRVRLAKIESPKTPDKMIRKINEAAAVAQETAAQDAKAQDAAAAQEVEVGKEATEAPFPEREPGPGDTNERCEGDKGAKGVKSSKGVKGYVQDRGQRCGQKPQLLAETRVAADAKIVADHVNAHDESVHECEARRLLSSS
ncbi:MAG: hypothetical protein K8T91_26050 [Planctomycetes bacterium]|nr:hypothetical protein [Planctomycetota bacterium]